jgi:hypothetical protein
MKEASKYTALLTNLLGDLAEQCSTKLCSRDVKTIRHRVKHEGLSFLTITLPEFCDDFFWSLEQGHVGSNVFIGWKKRLCLPAFLQGFTSLVFDVSTGRSLHEQNKKAVHAVRQIGYFFKKIQLPCTDQRVAKAIQSYVQTDNDLKRHIFDYSKLQSFRRVSRIILSSITPSAIHEEDLLPHHGPGSTFEKLIGNKKYFHKSFKWYQQLDKCFSQGLTTYPSEEYLSRCRLDNVEKSSPKVRVIHVPKTLKKPRIIAMEPVVMQMTQQSIKDFLVKRIERSKYTAGHVNFSDQSVNRDLALLHSQDRKLATIDLSAASDRVHNELVKIMLEINPGLSRMVQCTRSPLAKVDGADLVLSKFASMGSALCFPIEALVFFIICLLVRIECTSSAITPETLFRLSRDIYIYGDDILIPADEVESAVTFFADFGLKVNTSKSFTHSHFRESCGMDAFDGTEITPVYLRHPLPDRRRRADRIVSTVATVNQLFEKGLWRSATYLVEEVEKLTGVLPVKPTDTEGLGWVETSFLERKARFRVNRNLQRLEVQTLVPSISFKKDEIDGVPALLKCLLKLEQRPFYRPEVFGRQAESESLYLKALVSDEGHLSRTPVRGALTLKRRWVRAY